jgi:hypothetical protein
MAVVPHWRSVSDRDSARVCPLAWQFSPCNLEHSLPLSSFYESFYEVKSVGTQFADLTNCHLAYPSVGFLTDEKGVVTDRHRQKNLRGQSDWFRPIGFDLYMRKVRVSRLDSPAQVHCKFHETYIQCEI